MATTPNVQQPVYRHLTFRCGHTTRVNTTGWEPWRIAWTEREQVCVHCHRGRPAPTTAVASPARPTPGGTGVEREETLPRAVAALAICAVGEPAREAALPRVVARLMSLPAAWWADHGPALLGDPAAVLDRWAMAA